MARPFREVGCPGSRAAVSLTASMIVSPSSATKARALFTLHPMEFASKAYTVASGAISILSVTRSRRFQATTCGQRRSQRDKPSSLYLLKEKMALVT
jgi:hypothetical protein